MKALKDDFREAKAVPKKVTASYVDTSSNRDELLESHERSVKRVEVLWSLYCSLDKDLRASYLDGFLVDNRSNSFLMEKYRRDKFDSPMVKSNFLHYLKLNHKEFMEIGSNGEREDKVHQAG